MSEGARIHRLARAALHGLAALDPELRESLLAAEPLDLASNLNPYGGAQATYPPLRPTEVQERYASAVNRLAAGTTSLRGDQVLLTCGSVEGISLLVAAFCEPGRDCVCVCPPTFPFYARAASNNDVEVRTVPLRGECFEDIDVAAVVALQPRLTFLCSPSNPVGSLVDRERVEALLDADVGLVVVDEAYVEFSRLPSLIELVERYDHLVVLRTFSKAWGHAGIRLGAVIAGPEVLYTLRRLQPPFAISRTTLDAAIAAVAYPDAVAEQIQKIRSQRDAFADALGRLRRVTRVYPSEASFLMVGFDDATAIHRGLLAAGILVANTDALVPNTLRISIGTPEQCTLVLDSLRALDR